MTKYNQLEQINIPSPVNTINSDFFPHKYDMHWHKDVEIIALRDDYKGTEYPVITINQAEYQLNPGDVIFIWPGELHEITDNSNKALIGLQFPSTLFTEIHDFAPYINIFKTYHLLSASKDPDITKTLHITINKMIQNSNADSLFKNVEALISLYEMIIAFGTFINENSENLIQSKSNQTFDKINEACEYIQANCEKDLTLNSVSEYIGFSPSYFSRCFKQATSYNFIEYLSQQRIKKAQNLLIDSTLPITEVAFQAGFNSLSTFNRVFLQYNGCSPLQYKKYYVK